MSPAPGRRGLSREENRQPETHGLLQRQERRVSTVVGTAGGACPGGGTQVYMPRYMPLGMYLGMYHLGTPPVMHHRLYLPRC